MELLSFKDFLDETTSKPGQPIGPPKRPRSIKAIVSRAIPHKRNKGTRKPAGPLPVPAPAMESALPNKPEKAVAVVVPQKTRLQKLLRSPRGGKGGGARRGGYVRPRKGGITVPAGHSYPKSLKV